MGVDTGEYTRRTREAGRDRAPGSRMYRGRKLAAGIVPLQLLPEGLGPVGLVVRRGRRDCRGHTKGK